MSIDYTQIEVRHNEAAQRYEAQIGGQLAELTYSRQGNHIVYTHTGVPRNLEGYGIGGKLVHKALEDARAQKLTVTPLCSFADAYIRRHREYQDLLDPQE